MAETTCMIETTGYPESKSLRTELVCCFSILQYLSATAFTLISVIVLLLAGENIRFSSLFAAWDVSAKSEEKRMFSQAILFYEVHLVRLSLIKKFFNGAKVFVAKHFKVTAVQFSNSFDNINRDFGIVIHDLSCAS